MSFDAAERSLSRPAGLAQRLRAALQDPSYSANPDQVFYNMDTDPEIPDQPSPVSPTDRSSLLAELRSSGAAPDSASDRDVAQRFCWAHTLEGPDAPNSPVAVHGRVQSRKGLERAVAAQNPALTYTQAIHLIDSLLYSSLTQQRRILDGRQLGRFTMWSFPVTDPRRPWAETGETRDTMVDRLGLGHYVPQASELPEPLLRWAHVIPPSDPVKRPTAWDADITGRDWRPGGFTRTLATGQPGVPEVVHPPTTGQDLASPIELIP